MAVSRWDPFGDLMSIQSELNRLFGQTYGGQSGERVHGADWAPPLDVFETPDRYVILVELSGVGPDDIDISVEDNTLTLTGERKFYEGQSEGDFLRIERRFGAFGRTLSLPATANPEGIEASFDSGVLSIEVPKREEAKPRKIQVKARA
jgi:HSP20 family protein